MLLTKPPIISYNLFLSSTNNRPRHSFSKAFWWFLFDRTLQNVPSTPHPTCLTSSSIPLLLDHSIPITRTFLLSLKHNSSRKAFAFKCPICLLHCSPHIQGWRSCSFSSLRSLPKILSKPVPNKTILNRNPFPNHWHSAFPIPLSCFTFPP